MKLPLSPEALLAVKGWSPYQTCAFVCSSRKSTAQVVAVEISFDVAKREARKIGGCMRVGRIVDGFADTI